MEYLTLLGSVIQGIAALMGIVSVILLFIIEQKLAEATKILDNLNEKYMSSELNNIIVRRLLMFYVAKLDDVQLDTKFYNILAIFYMASSFLICVSILLLADVNSIYSLFISIFSIFIILIFLTIIYYIGHAPYSDIFKKWNPECIMEEKHFQEVLNRYVGCDDRLDIIEYFERNKKQFKKAKSL